jgi:hypothetical protein
MEGTERLPMPWLYPRIKLKLISELSPDTLLYLRPRIIPMINTQIAFIPR